MNAFRLIYSTVAQHMVSYPQPWATEKSDPAGFLFQVNGVVSGQDLSRPLSDLSIALKFHIRVPGTLLSNLRVLQLVIAAISSGIERKNTVLKTLTIGSKYTQNCGISGVWDLTSSEFR